MALFFKHVTNTLQGPLNSTVLPTPSEDPTTADYTPGTSHTSLPPYKETEKLQTPLPKSRRSLTLGISRAASNLRRSSSLRPGPLVREAGGLAATIGDTSASTSEQVTPRSQDLYDELVGDVGARVTGTSETYTSEIPMAGEAKVYEGNWVTFLFLVEIFFLLR
jgi:hypothetical protein